jgi:outer membrane protein
VTSKGVLTLRVALLAGFAGLIFLPSVARASSPATLTDALVEAYNNNATLQQQRAALRQADEGVPTALSGWRPTVQLSGDLGHIFGTEMTPTYYGSSDKTKVNENRSEIIGQASITQPLYQGGKTTASTRQAKNTVYATRAQLLATEQSVFTDVTTAYVSVVTDMHVLALQQSNAQVMQQQLHDTQVQFNLGEITMTSVAQAQASLAQANEQVDVAVGNLKISRENFRKLVGDYPADTLEPPQPLLLPVKSKQEAAAAALANNPNVVAAKYTDAALKDAVDVAFSALMPQLELQAAAYHQDGQSYANTTLNGGEVVGQLTVPLFQGGSEYSAIRAARAKEQQAFAAVLDQQRTAYEQATQGWVTLDSTRSAILSTNEAIKADAIALDGTEREELVGTRTTLDVLNAQQLLLSAQVQQVQNIATLVNNSYTVAAAIGRLTARDLGLPVREYDDMKYYNSVKYAAFGTGEAADQKAGVAPDGSLINATQAPVLPTDTWVPPSP